MRAPIRRKKDDVVIALDVRGDRLSAARKARQERAANPPPLDVAVATERLAKLLLLLALTNQDRRLGRPTEKTPGAIRDQICRQRTNMVRSGPEGAELATATTLALAGQGGRAMRTASNFRVGAREYAERVAILLSVFIVGGMRIPKALVRAGSSAMNQAVADMLRDIMVGLDPMVGAGVTKSRKLEDGSKLTHTVPTFDTLAPLVLKFEAQATKDTIAAQVLEREGREEERERERHRLQAAWSRPALPPTTTTTQDEDVSDPGALSLPSGGVAGEEHGSPTEARTLGSVKASVGEDDLSLTPDAKPSPRGAWAREQPVAAEDEGLDPEDPEPVQHADDVQAWDPERLRMVPASWIREGRRPPGARDGQMMVQRRQDEVRDLAAWELRVQTWVRDHAAWEQRRAARRGQREWRRGSR